MPIQVVGKLMDNTFLCGYNFVHVNNALKYKALVEIPITKKQKTEQRETA